MGKKQLGIMLAAVLAAGAAQAEALPENLKVCRAMVEDTLRLACYDRVVQENRLAAQETQKPQEHQEPQAPAAPVEQTVQAAVKDSKESSYLSRYWELDRKDKLGTFNFRPHRENYLIATYNPEPNIAPYRPLFRPGQDARLSYSELKYQLGFKLKLAENPANLPLDLWFGYTQTSFWQANNRQASSPFRETNYQPEIMAVVPMNLNLLGLKLRFVNFGLVHESNGQGSILSRSWNRSYVQAGFERGNFTLLARVWKRFNESASEDDNPNIIDYMGRGDVMASWHKNGYELSLLSRYNFSTDKGALRLGWAFPLTSHLKGYMQYFSGYGNSLIDYNAFQRVLGLGVMITY